MYKLSMADSNKDYYGFDLQEGFWDGEDTATGQKIATSGWEMNDSVALYFLENENQQETWKMNWVDNYRNFELDLENFPKIDTSEKMTFSTWLEEVQGISYHDYDENYSPVEATDLEKQYEAYYSDNVPEFVKIYAEENNIQIYLEENEKDISVIEEDIER